MYQLKYGNETVTFDLSSSMEVSMLEKPLEVVDEISEEEIILDALNNPIDSKRMEYIFKPGESVCLVVPDVTRLWQKTDVYIPLIVDKLNRCGVLDKDILVISAVGSHRRQTEDELKKLVTEDIYNRIEVVNHDAKGKLKYLGKTSYDNEIHVNERMMDYDHIFLTGGIVYHFLAGYSGGRKSILPGVAGYDTIMKNHRYSFNEGFGSGLNANVTVGKFNDFNPVHMDMMEATAMVNPSFLLNVAVNNGKISRVFAGDWQSAHEKGCEYVKMLDGIEIEDYYDCVITSPGGSPMDSTLYQTFKSILNASLALKKGGNLIVVSTCIEGVGSPDLEKLLLEYDNNLEREKFVRDNYTIGKGIALQLCLLAEDFNITLVSRIDEKYFKNTGFKLSRSMDEALSMLDKSCKVGILPNGTNCVPVIKD